MGSKTNVKKIACLNHGVLQTVLVSCKSMDFTSFTTNVSLCNKPTENAYHILNVKKTLNMDAS